MLKKIGKNLEKLLRTLLVIRPSSTEPERTFSAMDVFATMITNRLNEDSLNSMNIMQQFYRN